jgi:signal transduction histidine kinase
MSQSESAALPRLAGLLSGLPEAEVVGLLSRLLDALPVGVALYDASNDDFRVLYLNPASELLAEPGGNPAGRPFLDVYPEAANNRISSVFRDVRDSGRPRHYSEFTTPSGRSWDIRAQPIAGPEGGVRYLLLVGHEVSQQVAARRQVQIALDLAVALGSTLEPREVIRRLLERAVADIPADRATLSTILAEEIQVEASWDTSGEVDWAGRRYPISYLASQPLLIQALATRDVVLGGQLNANQAAPDVMSELAPIKHTAILPLAVREDRQAILILSRRTDPPFSPGEKGSLQLFANVATVALRNAELFSEAETARDQAGTLARRLRVGLDVAQDLATQLEPAGVVGRLLQRAVEAVDADRATLMALEGDEVVVEGSYAAAGQAVPVGSRWRIRDHPTFVNAVHKLQPSTGSRERTSSSDTVTREARHFMMVPLILDGEVTAILGVSRSSDRSFSPDDLATAQQVGNVAALRIRNVRLLAEAQHASRVKGEFLNLAAHELRTPFSVINGYLSMLQDGTLGQPPDSWLEPLRVLSLKSQEMGLMIDKLVLSSRLDAGALPAFPIRMDLCHAVRDAVGRARPRGLLLQAEVIEIVPKRPVVVEADPDAVARILDNLIDNALSYSRQPPWIKVVLAVRRGMAKVTVEDHGLGVPAALREFIFEPFVRVDDHRWEAPAGAGLGLYIARQLAQQCGASLTLDQSEEGRGSSFLLRLAICRDDRPPAQKPPR